MSKKLFGKITAFICAASLMTGTSGVTTFAENSEEIAENSAIEAVSDNGLEVINAVSKNYVPDENICELDDTDFIGIDSADQKLEPRKLKTKNDAWVIPIKADFSKKNQETFTVVFETQNSSSLMQCIFIQAGEDNEDALVYNKWNNYKRESSLNEETGVTTWTYYFRFSDASKIKNEDAELVFRYDRLSTVDKPAPDVNSFKIVYKDETVTAKDWAEKNKNTLENYMTATEPIEVREGFWILPVDVTGLMMHAHHTIGVGRNDADDNYQKIEFIGIRYGDFQHKSFEYACTSFNPNPSMGGEIKLDKVRNAIPDSLDWKKAQLVVKYATYSNTYKGLKPNWEAFSVDYPEPSIFDSESGINYFDNPDYMIGEEICGEDGRWKDISLSDFKRK